MICCCHIFSLFDEKQPKKLARIAKNKGKALVSYICTMSINYPPFLSSGDTVRIISTARKVSQEEIAPAIQLLESWGLKVETGKFLFSEYHQFAGTDSEREYDLQSALDAPLVKAIFCARGGYGTPRIIDGINWSEFKKHPKWVVGFSDMTVLLSTTLNQGFVSMHAPIALFFSREEYYSSVETLKAFLFGEKTVFRIPTHARNKNGITVGSLVGGSLSLIVNSIGTRSDFDPKGKILFLEDLDEYLYHLDRMMIQLKRADILSAISGLVIGYFSDMKDNKVPFGKTAYEIIESHVREYNYPICYGFPVGHEAPNMPLPVGALSKLTVDENGTLLEFI